MKSGHISEMVSKVVDWQNQSHNMWWKPAGTMFINFNSAAGQMEKWKNLIMEKASLEWLDLNTGIMSDS